MQVYVYESVYVCVGVCMCLNVCVSVCMCTQLAFNLVPIPQNLHVIRTERQGNGYKMGLIGQEGECLLGIYVPVPFHYSLLSWELAGPSRV